MKSKTNKMWHRICECQSIESLQPRYWERLKKIAFHLCTTDFSGFNKEEIITPLLSSLLYSDWKELRELSKLEKALGFLVD